MNELLTNQKKQTYYWKNRDKILADKKRKYWENVEEIREARRQYRLDHLEDFRKKEQKYRDKNREKINKYHKEWRATKKHTKILNKILLLQQQIDQIKKQKIIFKTYEFFKPLIDFVNYKQELRRSLKTALQEPIFDNDAPNVEEMAKDMEKMDNNYHTTQAKELSENINGSTIKINQKAIFVKDFENKEFRNHKNFPLNKKEIKTLMHDINAKEEFEIEMCLPNGAIELISNRSMMCMFNGM